MSEIEQRVHERMVYARKAACLSQAEMGKRMGLLQSMVSRMERGDMRLSDLVAYAEVLGKPLSYFLDEIPPAEMVAAARFQAMPFHNFKTAGQWLRQLVMQGETVRVREAENLTADDLGRVIGCPVAEWESGELAIRGGRHEYRWARWLYDHGAGDV